jgi:hypothetical protein
MGRLKKPAGERSAVQSAIYFIDKKNRLLVSARINRAVFLLRDGRYVGWQH